MDWEIRTIERPGARVAYEVAGDGTSLVLGHSLLCDGRMWEAVAPALTERCRVVNVDARGHRRSPAEGPFTLDDLADDWLAILDREGVDRAVLCGLSMGGMTAMRLALKAPDRVAGLVLLDTSARAERRWPRLQYRAMAEVVRRVGFVEAFVPKIQRAMFGRATLRGRPDLVARVTDRIRENDPRQLYFACRAVFDRPSILDRIEQIRCPTFVVVGDDDASTPPSEARRIASRIPGAALVPIPAAGHLTAIEAPDAVLAAVHDLLEAARP